jgi:hypothetical protein
MGRNKKYPYFLKKVELNKTTDQNYFKIISPKSYIQVSLPYDMNFSVSKYTNENKYYRTDKDFEDKHVYINIDEQEYESALQKTLSYLGAKNDLISLEMKLRKDFYQKIRSVIKEADENQKTAINITQSLQLILNNI